MNNRIGLSVYIQKFFTSYLAIEQRVSHHTIRSYRDTFVLILKYFDKVRNIMPDHISIQDLTSNTVVDFLNWMQDIYGCKPVTRNQRLSAIKSFARFLQFEDPIHIAEWNKIRRIPNQKYERGDIRYMTVDGIKRLLEEIPTSTHIGRKHLTIITLMYETAMRASEVCQLTPSSFRQSTPYIIEVKGKGNKKRLIPIEDNMAKLLLRYMSDNGLDNEEIKERPLFRNRYGGQLSTSGISYVIKKYADKLRLKHPELVPDKVGPHDLRRSRAMHWLQAGVDVYYIKDLLGHVDIKTTEVYAKADSKLKREAIEKASELIGIPEPNIKTWERLPKLKEFLMSLSATHKRDTRIYQY